MSDMDKCPVMGAKKTNNTASSKNEHWWPNQVNL